MLSCHFIWFYLKSHQYSGRKTWIDRLETWIVITETGKNVKKRDCIGKRVQMPLHVCVLKSMRSWQMFCTNMKVNENMFVCARSIVSVQRPEWNKKFTRIRVGGVHILQLCVGIREIFPLCAGGKKKKQLSNLCL